MITAAPIDAPISLCSLSMAAPTKRQPMPAPTTTCAAATSSPGGLELVRPPRWAMALISIGPIMKAAGRRSRRPTVAPTRPQAISIGIVLPVVAGRAMHHGQHAGLRAVHQPVPDRDGHHDGEDAQRMGKRDGALLAAHRAAHDGHVVQPARHGGEVAGLALFQSVVRRSQK